MNRDLRASTAEMRRAQLAAEDATRYGAQRCQDVQTHAWKDNIRDYNSARCAADFDLYLSGIPDYHGHERCGVRASSPSRLNNAICRSSPKISDVSRRAAALSVSLVSYLDRLENHFQPLHRDPYAPGYGIIMYDIDPQRSSATLCGVTIVF